MSQASSSFELLHPSVQRWIWDQQWDELRDIQEEAVQALYHSTRDVVIAAATARGKTEAAFLPIASQIADAGSPEGLQVLVVSPLKALINDQFLRLEGLFEQLDLPVHRWHGDVDAGRKRKALEKPSGIVLITPESLEALFVRQGSRMPKFLSSLRYLVIDELHAFIGTERGRQLQSLLHRIELATGGRIPRIALSATLGDMAMACDFLRPGEGGEVRQIVSTENPQEVKLQVRGYLVRPLRQATLSASAKGPEEEGRQKGGEQDEEVRLEDLATGDMLDIARDLYGRLRGGRHIVFANRRSAVEEYAGLLRTLSEKDRVPVEFYPHHGSLSKSLREDAETALKDRTRPATVIATSTLELGIDVGEVETIVQLGPPPSVASMRQRLGRSGRRGEAAVMRLYIQEQQLESNTPPQDQLRADLVQTVAMIRLLARRWYEPPIAGRLHLSTLVQQVLSLVAEHGGIRAHEAWRTLCKTGPFRDVTPAQFADLLRDLARQQVLSQTHDGEIVLDLSGERLVNHYDFYTAFATSEEYRLVSGTRTLGTLPIDYPILPKSYLIFGGRRWEVLTVDSEKKVVDLKAAAGGRAPSFGGHGAWLHDQVRSEMRRVYEAADLPPFLDGEAQKLLTEARDSYLRFDLGHESLLGWGSGTLLFPWAGDRVMNTLALLLTLEDYQVTNESLALRLEAYEPGDVREVLRHLVRQGPADPVKMAQAVKNKPSEKHHPLLGPSLLAADYASGNLDTAGAHQALLRMLKSAP